MNTSFTGVILAGGKSSRMDKDKGLVILNGKKLIEHILNEVQKVCEKIIIITNQSGYEYLNIPLFKDIIENQGPMAGIYSGLHYSKTANILVVGCDMPFINSSLLQHLMASVKDFDAVVPNHNGQMQPLCAVYSKACLPQIEKSLESKQLKMVQLINLLKAKHVTIDKKLDFYRDNLFKNINTEKDLNEAKKRI